MEKPSKKFRTDPFEKLGLTFDDVLILPEESDVLPHQVSVASMFSRHVALQVPVVSAAMDTVTEAAMAIALAQLGGIGVIHRNASIERQAEDVAKVKRFESVMITNPMTLSPRQTVGEAMALMAKHAFSGFPVVQENGHGCVLVGIVTSRDMKGVKNRAQTVSEVMTKDHLITATEGTPITQAQELLQQHRIEKLPVVDRHGLLKGLITMKDIEKRRQHPESCKDALGRLRVAAAIGTGPEARDRADALVSAGVDVLVVDTAHGHTKGVYDSVKYVKKRYPKVDVVAGNVGTAEGAKALIRAGVDGIKVGIGPGSICTTRIVAGIGVPQITAVYECGREAARGGIPVIADGGIRYSGDAVKALAAGASSIMLGNLLAGTDESPGDVVFLEGRRFKQYQAMGSLAAMRRGSDRYPQSFREESGAGARTDGTKLVPEGVEARVPYRGPVASCVYQIVGGLKAGMGYCGAATIPELQRRARFVRITPPGLRESHPHDVSITSEPPNYWLS